MNHCFKEFEEHKSEESAVECLRCLKEHYEELFFDDTEKRLKLASEEWDKEVTKYMVEISDMLNIKSREQFIEVKEKYNLTIY
ncbi:MAG: hypothetical protein ACP5NL_01980 [Thermoplasmata archaeon]